MGEFDAQKLTWAALMAHWVEFARSAVALPDDAVGRAQRAIVPDLIGLQAVTMALKDRQRLRADDLGHAVSRARVITDRHAAHIHERLGPKLHPKVKELIDDARKEIQVAEAELEASDSDSTS